MDVLGADSNLQRLAEQIDMGIEAINSKRTDSEVEWQQWYRKWHDNLKPLKYLVMVLLIAQTLFERPYWCLYGIKLHKLNQVTRRSIVGFPENYKHFNSSICDFNEK